MNDNLDVRVAILETIAANTNQTLIRLENKMELGFAETRREINDIRRDVTDVRKEMTNHFRWILASIVFVVSIPYVSAAVKFLQLKLGI